LPVYRKPWFLLTLITVVIAGILALVWQPDDRAIDPVPQTEAGAEIEDLPIQPALSEPASPPIDHSEAEPIAPQAEEKRQEAAPVAQDGVVLVQVLDQAGTPVAGIEVAIGMRIPFEGRAIRLGSAVSAGKNGLAKIELAMEYMRKNAGIFQNPELMADAKFPTSASARIKFLLEDGMAKPQKLVVPDFQWLQAHISFDGGKVPDFPTYLQVYWGPLTNPDNSTPWSNRRSIWIDVVNGAAQFACGADLQLWLTAKAKDAHCRPGELRTVGPASGEAAPAPFEIALGENYPRFHCQFVLADGTPAVSARLAQYHLNQRLPNAKEIEQGKTPDSVRPRWQRIATTDADGWLKMPLESGISDDQYHRSLAFVLQGSDPRGRGTDIDSDGAHQVKFDLPNHLAPGEIFNPGPLTLSVERLPMLAAGQILSDSGEPISLTVSAYGKKENGSFGNRLAQIRSGQDGKFEILGPAPADGQIRVSTGGFGWLGDAQIVAAGTQNLLFTLTKGINLKGQFLSDAPLPWLDMEVRIPNYHRSKEVFGSFKFDYLRPANDYIITLEHNDVELYRSPEFIVNGSGDVAPALINPIDLRGKLRVWSVTPLQSDGKPFPAKTYFMAKSEDDPLCRVRTNMHGLLTQVTSSDVDQISIIPREGYQEGILTWPLTAEKLQLIAD
jgi:hypothetical protein